MEMSKNQNTCLWKGSGEKLNELRKKGQLCDITICSEDGYDFLAHSPLMAASSEVFYAFLIENKSSLIENISDKKLRVKGLKSDVLQVTLDFIYGVLPSNFEDCFKLKTGTEVLQVKGASVFCYIDKNDLKDKIIGCPYARKLIGKKFERCPYKHFKTFRPKERPSSLMFDPHTGTSENKIAIQTDVKKGQKQDDSATNMHSCIDRNHDQHGLLETDLKRDQLFEHYSVILPVDEHHAMLNLADIETQECPHLQNLAKESGLWIFPHNSSTDFDEDQELRQSESVETPTLTPNKTIVDNISLYSTNSLMPCDQLHQNENVTNERDMGTEDSRHVGTLEGSSKSNNTHFVGVSSNQELSPESEKSNVQDNISSSSPKLSNEETISHKRMRGLSESTPTCMPLTKRIRFLYKNENEQKELSSKSAEEIELHRGKPDVIEKYILQDKDRVHNEVCNSKEGSIPETASRKFDHTQLSKLDKKLCPFYNAAKDTIEIGLDLDDYRHQHDDSVIGGPLSVATQNYMDGSDKQSSFNNHENESSNKEDDQLNTQSSNSCLADLQNVSFNEIPNCGKPSPMNHMQDQELDYTLGGHDDKEPASELIPPAHITDMSKTGSVIPLTKNQNQNNFYDLQTKSPNTLCNNQTFSRGKYECLTDTAENNLSKNHFINNNKLSITENMNHFNRSFKKNNENCEECPILQGKPLSMQNEFTETSIEQVFPTTSVSMSHSCTQKFYSESDASICANDYNTVERSISNGSTSLTYPLPLSTSSVINNTQVENTTTNFDNSLVPFESSTLKYVRAQNSPHQMYGFEQNTSEINLVPFSKPMNMHSHYQEEECSRKNTVNQNGVTMGHKSVDSNCLSSLHSYDNILELPKANSRELSSSNAESVTCPFANTPVEAVTVDASLSSSSTILSVNQSTDNVSTRSNSLQNATSDYLNSEPHVHSDSIAESSIDMHMLVKTESIITKVQDSSEISDVENKKIIEKLLLMEKTDNTFRCYQMGCKHNTKCLDMMQSHMYNRHKIGSPTKECHHCHKSFFSENQLNNHIRRSHVDKKQSTPIESTIHNCTDCEETFDSIYKLQTHLLKMHGKGKLFTCKHCSFKSPRKKDVQAHMLSQHGEAPPGVKVYTCERCQYQCIDRNRFEEHQAKHSGAGIFTCNLCGKKYSTRRGLRTHQMYHSTDKPHVCSHCDASFKVKSKLKDHIRLVHTSPGVKPFQCSYCSHKTALRGNCNQHIRKHHPGMPVQVIDLMADKRKFVKPYDYAGIEGDGIEEVNDVRAAAWAERR